MELWDLYNNRLEKLGKDIVRGQELPSGAFHLIVGIIVRHSDGTYLITKRDPNKEPWPGYDEIGAGGSAIKGEDSLKAAKRELREETGIIAEKLINISTTIQEEYHSICVCYLCEYSGDKAIKLQQGENVDYKWINKQEFLNFINSDKCIPSQKLRLSSFIDSVYF